MVEIFENTEEQIKRLTKFAREVKVKEDIILRPLNNELMYTSHAGVMKNVVNANSEGIAEPSL